MIQNFGLWKLTLIRGLAIVFKMEMAMLMETKMQYSHKTGLHWPGIEPGPPAWQARILPLNHQCVFEGPHF